LNKGNIALAKKENQVSKDDGKMYDGKKDRNTLAKIDDRRRPMLVGVV
jgi:hypothetical protein